MVNTGLTTALSFNTIDPFNSAGGQSLFVGYKVSGIPAALLCGSLLGSLNLLCLDECSLVHELGESSGGKSELKQEIMFLKGLRGTNWQPHIITKELHLHFDGVAMLCLSLALSGMVRYIFMLLCNLFLGIL